jgi:DNA-binding response OmpR family regulator
MSAKILVVEDERLIGTMVKINLENEGYEVDWISDGAEARGPATSGDHDLLVFDLLLPGRSGMDLVSDVRAAGLGVPIIILTAHSETDMKVQGLERGADDYLTKPFDVAELLARVKALIRRGSEPESRA